MESAFSIFCAIIVASVGLNTNSTAVIIGAILISTLMNLIGEVYIPEQIEMMKTNMAAYGLEDYTLEVVQDIRTTLFNYFEKENSAGILDGEIVIV